MQDEDDRLLEHSESNRPPSNKFEKSNANVETGLIS